MKRLLFFLFIWLLFVNSSERTDFWVELYTIRTTTVKVKRSDYNEFKEYLDYGTSISKERESDIDWNKYYCFESDYKPQMSKINGYTLKELKTMLNITYSKAIKNDLDYFYGKPTYCKITITDVMEETYSTEIHLPKDWTNDKFTDLLTQSFHLCDHTPKSVHIDELRLNVMNLN